MKRLSTLLTTLLVTAACTQNPFPTSGRVVQRQPEKPAPVVPPLVLDSPETVEVMEGQLAEFPINVSVPKPGKPLLSIQGLPAGAVYNPETGKVTWTPTFQDANDTRDLSVIVRTYPLKMQLSSSEDPVTVTQGSTLLVVRDVTRPIKVTLPAPTTPTELKEGKLHEQIIDVQSEDYPNGPFEIQIKNLPVGALVQRDLTNPARFKVIYTPSFREVNVNETFSSFSVFVDKALEVSVFGPRGVTTTANTTWRIFDVREKAILLSPVKITQGTSVSFTISAEDPNGEEAPSLSLAPRPSFGLSELKVETTNPGNPARGVNPSTVASFRWVQIPPEKIGTTADVVIRACVKRSRWVKDFCTDQTVKVTFTLESHKAPIVDRGEFPLEATKYVRERESISFPILVKDGEFNNTAPSVKILPDTLKDEISYSGGRLIITGKKAGRKQFQLVATSVFGVVQVESFLVEVLPASWPSVLLFGDSPSVTEVKSTSEFFEEVPQVANPVTQQRDPLLLVLRKAAFIGTTAFLEPTVIDSMEKLAAQIDQVVVSTPLLDKLESSLKAELAETGVTVKPRVADLTGYELEIDAASGFQSPLNPIKLAGKATSESASPTPITLGASCKPLLNLKKAGEDPLVIAAKCTRKSSTPAKPRYLIVAGFEFADIQTTPADNRLVKKWMKDLVVQ